MQPVRGSVDFLDGRLVPDVAATTSGGVVDDSRPKVHILYYTSALLEESCRAHDGAPRRP